MSKVTDLGAYLKQRDAEKDLPVVIEKWSVHESQLTLPLHAKLDIISRLTLNGWLEHQDIKAQEANYLAQLAKDIMLFVHLRLKMFTSAAVRERDPVTKDMSLYMFGGDVANYHKADENSEKLVTNFQLELCYLELDDDEVLGANRVYPIDIEVRVPDSDGIGKCQLVQMLTNLDRLVYANSGKSELHDGSYVAFIPYSPRYAICIALVPEIPFTLKPD